MAIEMLLEKAQVLAVSLESEVKRIADKRNHADQRVDGVVAVHAGLCPTGDAKPFGFPHNECADENRNQVADEGYESDDSVQTDSDLGARNLHEIIHNGREQGDARMNGARFRRPLLQIVRGTRNL